MTFPHSPKLYEICSGGPVMIYYASAGRNKKNQKFAFQIQHGWQPLCLSTAYCFSRVICQSEVPVIISSDIDIVVQGKNVHLFVSHDCHLKQESGSQLEEQITSHCQLPRTNVAMIYGAKLRRFGDRIEAWITDGMTVYSEAGKATCLDGSQTRITRCEVDEDND